MIPGTRVKFIGPSDDTRTGAVGTIIPSAVEVAGFHLLVLDGSVPADLRAEHPAVPVYLVAPDEVEVIVAPVETEHGSYVPNCMSPKEPGYGDYVIMDIGPYGVIAGWQPKLALQVGVSDG